MVGEYKTIKKKKKKKTLQPKEKIIDPCFFAKRVNKFTYKSALCYISTGLKHCDVMIDGIL